MKRLVSCTLALAIAVGALTQSAAAQLLSSTSTSTTSTSSSTSGQLIVRDTLGLNGLNLTCVLLGCQVKQAIGDPSGQLFVVTTPSLVNPILFIANLLLQPGITAVEIDQPVGTQSASAGSAPSYLNDRTGVNFYGTTVWEGYVTQPAVQLIRSTAANSTYNATGLGATVAVIDTGVDPNNPVLQPVLVAGYDFTRNMNGGSEMADVSQSTVAVVDGTQPAQVNQSTVAVVDQSTVAVVDDGYHNAFGHGTMTAGVVHLVAPQAKIMPLKSFNANGSGYASDVLRAIYYAVQHGADVISMSFDFSIYSPELKNAVNYANNNGVICVASAGNDGQQVAVYPGALPNVIDVASTTNQDTQSSFSNYGAPPVKLAAPGEAIMTTYPWGTYAAGWGTSFSAPFVSGTVALMVGTNSSINESQAAYALSYSQPISAPGINNLRLDTYKSLQSWRATLGLN
jgi:subtilisin family serine protease